MAAVQVTIGGGVADSTAFRWSSALSEILSRPPGLPDCDPSTPCGVPGVIASAQTFDDPVILLKALIEGRVATAVIPAMPVFRARCQASGPQKPGVTVLKSLYRQPLYVVVRGGQAGLIKPRDWIGKVIATGPAGSDSEMLAGALLDAYGVPRSKVKLLRLPVAEALASLQTGSAAVAILIGRIYDGPVGNLLRHGFTLMSLPDSPERNRFLKAMPVLEATAIATSAFPGLPPTSTVAQSVSWMAGPALDPAITATLVAAISDPRNLIRLEARVDPVPDIPETEAFTRLPAPPAEGARSFAVAKHLPIGMLGCPAANH